MGEICRASKPTAAGLAARGRFVGFLLLTLAAAVPASADSALEIPGVEDREFLDAYARGLERVMRDWNESALPGRGEFLGEPVSGELQRDNGAWARFYIRVNSLNCSPAQVSVFGRLTREGIVLPPRWDAGQYRLFCRHRDELLFYWGLRLIADGLKLSAAEFAGIVSSDAIRSIYEFEQAARAYDPGLRDTEIQQASRNFTTAIGLQYVFRLPFETHDAAIAYSLLYPYVDNVLDDTDIDAAGKERFARQLFARLSGLPSSAGSTLERKVFDMVDRIYAQYPPTVYPRARQSLLAIFHGQMMSLSQREPSASLAQIETISQFKGAASVLTSAYLVDPPLDPQEFEFALSFGYLLQLVDDLEDMADDRRHGQRTQLSVLPKGGHDAEFLCERIFAYAEKVLQFLDRRPHADNVALKHAFRGSIRLLMLRAIALQQSQFSSAYLRDIERFSPYRLNDLKYFDPEESFSRFGRSVELGRIETLLAGSVPQPLESIARQLTRHLP